MALSPRQIEKAIELWSEGLGWTEIGKKLGVHKFSVQFALERRGFSSNKTTPGPEKRWDTNQAIVLKQKGFNLRDISQILGISYTTIFRFFKSLK